MRVNFAMLFIVVLILAGCSSKESAPLTSAPAQGHLSLKVSTSSSFSSTPVPGPKEVDNIFITIKEVAIHRADTDGFITLSEPNQTYDFLELVDGVEMVLADVSLDAGHYTQLRLILGENNEVVVNEQSYPLFVPSGIETGVKINLNVTIEEGQLTDLVLNFDPELAIFWTDSNYILVPAFSLVGAEDDEN